MSLSNVIRDLNSVYQRLFDHSPALQSEATFIYNEFEQHPRSKDFDSLLTASHGLKEALDCEVEERLAAAPLDAVAARLHALTDVLSKATKEDHSDYVAEMKRKSEQDWAEFDREIQRKRADVESQFAQKMEEMNLQFARLDQK